MKRDDTLRALFNLAAKQVGVDNSEITREDRELIRVKQAELESTPELEVDFDFNFPDVKTKAQVEERLGILRVGLRLEATATREAVTQDAENWDDPDRIYKMGGNRIYYNRQIFSDVVVDRARTPLWTAIATTYQLDITGEINSVILLGSGIPDYKASFNNLRKICLARTYTPDNMRDCLIRVASHYEGYHATTFDGMSANQIARMFLRSQLKVNKRCYYKQQLELEVRKKRETILTAFTRAEALIKNIYST